MSTSEPRDRATRKADSLARLTEPAVDAWVATASVAGRPYLVPLSLAWVAERAVIALEASSVTARNLTNAKYARLGLGPTRDVVLIDATVERWVDAAAGDPVGDAYAAQADWDPRGVAGYVYFVLRPTRIQAWREADELAGRLLMRHGAWLV
jgi:hypothetical protein